MVAVIAIVAVIITRVVGLQTKYRPIGRLNPTKVMGFPRMTARYSLANGREMTNSKTASDREGKQHSGQYSSMDLSSEQKITNLLFLSAAFGYAILYVYGWCANVPIVSFRSFCQKFVRRHILNTLIFHISFKALYLTSTVASREVGQHQKLL